VGIYIYFVYIPPYRVKLRLQAASATIRAKPPLNSL